MLKETRFTEKDLCSILMVYYKFVLGGQNNAKFMSQTQFISFFDSVFEIRNNVINTRILQVVSKDGRNFIKPIQWVRVFAVYMKGTLDEKMKFCFDVYDEEGKGYLTYDHMKKIMDSNNMGGDDEDHHNKKIMDSNNMGDDDEDEFSADEILDLILRKMDKDRDGKISYSDYTQSVRESPVLLEFLGQCIPDQDTIFQAAHRCNLWSILEKFL